MLSSLRELLVDCLLFAAFVSLLVCALKLLLTCQATQNFKQQLSFFHESARETEKRIDVLDKRYNLHGVHNVL
ncbi:MAG: hypothetical protein D3903_14590 [Candidatus Electrothrix sp. GM3_4]|nr:hypothetical protein [Candidatus Electrothrix sp. GM3_4]